MGIYDRDYMKKPSSPGGDTGRNSGTKRWSGDSTERLQSAVAAFIERHKTTIGKAVLAFIILAVIAVFATRSMR
jgi:hypothetical protein